MRVVEVTKYGPPEVLQVRTQLEPVPEPNEVVIRVRAAGVNFADILMRLGLYTRTPKPPFVPGFEVSGVVEAIGIDVPALRVGDRVLASTFPGGGYADQVAVRADRVLPLPEKMSFEDAAALPVNYLTAYQALTYMANLRRGERVLIHAAAGGVEIGRAHV